MPYVVVAVWKAKEGKEEIVARAIEQLSIFARQEPGVLMYQGHRSLTDPRVFFLYEQYVDKAAHQAHLEAPHTQKYGWGECIPNLESRERSFYEII